MKVVVNLRLCEGNGRCEEVAGEIFEVRDDRSQFLVDRPPPELRDKLQLAMRLCPRQAIHLIDD